MITERDQSKSSNLGKRKSSLTLMKLESRVQELELRVISLEADLGEADYNSASEDDGANSILETPDMIKKQ